MNCIKAKNQISALLDGKLDIKKAHLLNEHLKNCPDCRKLYHDMKNAVSLMKSADDMNLPEGFETRMHFAFRREGEAERKPKLNYSKLTMIAMPATVAVFAAIIGINYILSGGLFGKSADESAMSARSADESLMQKNELEPEIAMFTMDADGGNLWLDSKFVLQVTITGENLKDMYKQAKNIMFKLDFLDGAYPDFSDKPLSTEAHIPYKNYEQLLGMVEDDEMLSLIEIMEPEEIYEDDSYFKVTFLFQTIND